MAEMGREEVVRKLAIISLAFPNDTRGVACREAIALLTQQDDKQSQPMSEVTPKQLHDWYLEATKKLNPDSYNHKAQVDYESLTKEQQFIDEYIADKINALLQSPPMSEEELGNFIIYELEQGNWQLMSTFLNSGDVADLAKKILNLFSSRLPHSPEITVEEWEKLFDNYQWIEFEGRKVLAIHPEEIAQAIVERMGRLK